MLEVEEHGSHLRFICRIGHVYSLEELIQAKEHQLEHHLWSPVTTLEELAALLDDAIAGSKSVGAPAAYEERAARARRQARAIRKIIQENEPTKLQRDGDLAGRKR